ncbi:hypothetical protein FRB90_006308 [Tulasnella sp. 427]|nr:hypothetical protein FRB90_006308 [Tulasnella sp. 427]
MIWAMCAEELIAAAPSDISLFGALNLKGASAESDFDLNVPTHNGTRRFKYLKSVSDRAAVYQLQMAGLAAFSQSRDNLSMLAARSDELKAIRDVARQAHVQPGVTTVLYCLPTSFGDVQHDPKTLAIMETLMEELQKWELQAQQDMLSVARKELQDFNRELDSQIEAEVGPTLAPSKEPLIVRAAPGVTEAPINEDEVVAEPE